MLLDKRTKKLLKTLEAQGARLKKRKSGYMAFPPDRSKRAVMIHLTPSDHRAWDNMIAELRKSGFDL